MARDPLSDGRGSGTGRAGRRDTRKALRDLLWIGSGRRPVVTRSRLPEDPTAQLALLRDWQHDTVQMPRIEAYEIDGTPVAPLGAVPAASDEAAEEVLSPGRTPRRRRWRPTPMVGGALLAAALVLSGLAATGIGPARDLLGNNSTPGNTTGGAGQPPGTNTGDNGDNGGGGGARSAAGGGSRTGPGGGPPAATTKRGGWRQSVPEPNGRAGPAGRGGAKAPPPPAEPPGGPGGGPPWPATQPDHGAGGVAAPPDAP